jgi:transcriptional regulator with XRE-family HTH domain
MRAPVASHVLLAGVMRAVRQHLGIAQPALARRMRCDRSYVSQFENAHGLPGEQAWETWLRAVGEAAGAKPRQPEWTAELEAKVAEAKRLYAQACADTETQRKQSFTAAQSGRAVDGSVTNPVSNAFVRSDTADLSPTVALPRREGDDAMRRRDFLGFAGLGLAGVVAPPLRPLGRIDETVVSELERMLMSFEGLEGQVSPSMLIDHVRGYQQTCEQLLDRAPSEWYAPLCSLLAEGAALAGWLEWDAKRPMAARGYFLSGLEAAREADDRALGAYLAGSLCVLPAWRERPLARIRQLEDMTFGFQAADATPATRAWLACLKAEASARMGDATASLSALEDAQEAITAHEDDPSRRRPRASFFDATRLAGEQAFCRVKLGEGAAAESELRSVLDALPPTQVKTRPRLLAALGLALVQQGEIPEACRLGSEALTLAHRQQVAPNVQSVWTLRAEMAPWQNHPAIRELDEQLTVSMN